MMNKDPIQQFTAWFNDVKQTALTEPTAMTVATSTAEGTPSARILLLKKFDERGFCFFTNFTSRKAKELLENPKAALCFYWDELGRQVRIEGNIEQVSEEEADDYFATRRRESQIGAWASKQSSLLKNRDELTNRIKEITAKYQYTDSIPRPPFWSGFRVIPHRIEFWENGEFRLHTRTIYTKQNNSWEITSLYP